MRLPDNEQGMFDVRDAEILARVERLVNELETVRSELHGIKRSRSYRLVQRLLQSRYGRLVRRAARIVLPVAQLQRSSPGGLLQRLKRKAHLMRLAPNMLVVRAIGERSPESGGTEVWLLSAHADHEVDLTKVRYAGDWQRHAATATASGICLVSVLGGDLYLPTAPNTSLLFLTHPWSGVVEIMYQGQKRRYDLYHPDGGVLEITPSNGQSRTLTSPPSQVVSSPVPQFHAQGFTPSDQAWLERYQHQRKPLALLHPEWRGIRSSTSQLFDELFFLPDTLDQQSGLYYARLFAEAQCPIIVIQGFPLTYSYFVQAIRRIAPTIPIAVVWHGTFLQAHQDYAWQSFCTVEQFCREGFISRWGFVKQGMAEIMAAKGFRTGFIMNIMRDIPEAASNPLKNGPHIGIWNINPTWHKLPYEMLASTITVPGCVVHASGVDHRVSEFTKTLGIKAHLSKQPVEQRLMPEKLAQMHLNMYVTFNECAPMVPLESLSVGTPCLIGPNTYYFQNHEYLREHLVVPQPDSAWTITRYATRAIEERSKIIEAYRNFAPEHNQQAWKLLENFVGMPLKPADQLLYSEEPLKAGHTTFSVEL